MSEQAQDIASYTREKKTSLDYLFLVGGWFVSFFSLLIEKAKNGLLDEERSELFFFFVSAGGD